MTEPLKQLRRVRLEKLAKILRLGIDPYPASCARKQTITQARQMMDKMVMIAGRLRAMRGHGGIQFYDLEDESGKIQLVLKKEELKDKDEQLLVLLDIGDFVEIWGSVFKTQAGEISVLVKYLKLLTKSLRPLPSKWYGLKDVEERYRQRYVDLAINPEVKKIFYLRTKVLRAIREFLDNNGFLEVETPILQPMYGGASAKPFITHHNSLDCDLYLRISDELYLKRLIVGGFEKVYEVSKDFRNEGIDRAHNPEFTQVEFYWAYADYEDLIKLTEELIADVIKQDLGKVKTDFKFPIPKVTFQELLLKETGIDINKVAGEKEILAEIKKEKIKIDLKGIIGLGGIFDKLYKEKIRPKIVEPTFVLDYPASMIALAKRKEKNPEQIASFQLLANGFELIKAYNELNDPIDQKTRWSETEKLSKKGDEAAERLDEDYIRALEYGMPPTAGWGMGIDRLVSVLTGLPLKEVILFPTLKPEK